MKTHKNWRRFRFQDAFTLIELLERSFPGLATARYQITSSASSDYNGAAWAAGETHRWWEPSMHGGYFWPTAVPPAHSLASFVAAFAVFGYEPGADARLEPGIEKLALYADELGSPTHVARQLASGAWTSKLGASEDLEHDTLAALEGALYGRVAQHLRRSRVAEGSSRPPLG